MDDIIETARSPGYAFSDEHRLLESMSIETIKKVRFLFFGGLNVVIAFAVYSTFLLIIGEIRYMQAAIVSHVVSSFVSYSLNRHFVFRSLGSYWKQLMRFQATLLVVLGLNIVLLAILVGGLTWHPIPAQLLCLVPVSIASYYGHRFFSFHRPRNTTDRSAPSTGW